ncbi:MAG: vWA domain-containing protein [Dehalococcoidia bacterium]
MTNASGADPLLRQLASVLGQRAGTLAGNLVGFSRLLKLADFQITSGRVIDAGRGLAAIDLSRPEDVRATLRASFVTSMEQLALFDRLFDLYWRRRAGQVGARLGSRTVEGELPRLSQARRQGRMLATPRPAHQPKQENPEGTYSGVDLLTSKDFSAYTDDDVRRARRIIRQLAPKLATSLSRRRQASRSRGAIDLRRSLRHSVKHGGEVVELFRQRRRVRNLRLVLLCDVSGSMDTYSRFLVQFLFAMQNELRGVSTFVFSTRLDEVTHLLKTRSFEEALAQISEEVDSWSGGTSIGASLFAFERGYGRQRVDSRTVILIISDGWDRGDVTLLTKAMQAFRRRAHTIIWLNPLLGGRDYRPVAKGMAAALPYTDYFLPAHNLESLARLARTLVHLGRQ